MRTLGLRFAAILIALAVIVTIILDVAFILWTQVGASRERNLRLQVAAQAVALELGRAEPDRERLAQLASEWGVVLSLRSRSGEILSTAELELPADLAGDSDAIVRGGYAHAHIALSDNPRWEAVIASASLQGSIAAVWDGQRTALGVFLAAAAVMVLSGLFFLRRAVLRPLSRMTEQVSVSDYDGLASFDPGSGDGLARLGRAIIGMGQRIREDREQIAAQLAELTAAHHDLKTTQAQLLRAERLAVVGKLAAGLAHEIGNPLAVVRGFVELLEGDPALADQAEAHKAIDRMATELDRIQETIRQLLDFSRAPSSAPGNGDVRIAFDHVEGLLRPQKRLRRVALTVAPPAAACAVAITTDALTQVLLNLALNAVDAMAGEGELRIAAQPSATSCTITVDDSGPGIPPAERSRVLEPFYTTKPAGAGTGLGLSVCERLLTAAGGDLEIDDSPQGGARLSLTLPRVSGDQELDRDQAVDDPQQIGGR